MNAQGKIMKFLVLMVIFSLCFSGCSVLSPTQQPAQQSVADDAVIESIVSATGLVVPERWVGLSAMASGVVKELLIKEGQAVETGQALLRLSGVEQLQADLAAARYEAVLAQQALDQLNDDVAVRRAQAQQAVVLAEQAVLTAQRAKQSYEEQDFKDDLDKARQDILDAEEELKQAKEDFEPYKDFDEGNETRKQRKEDLDESQRNYDEKERILREMELAVEQAGADLELVKARLELAKKEVADLKDGPAPAELEEAQARLEDAQARQAAVEASIADLELRAPFAGIISAISVRQGEYISPGNPIIYLGDLSSLQVETTDLNEIDVARISTGSVATVTFDALPGISVVGEVVRIAPRSSAGSGVNYKVVVRLSEIPEHLRWGMTAFVDIEVK